MTLSPSSTRLIDKNAAYVGDGDVFFAVASFEDYGKLSGRKLEDMIAGSRIEINTSKRNPYDFVLWKAAKPGEPSWASPWGEGRPGWHIECSAMSRRLLGETFDIHGGGKDLIFPTMKMKSPNRKRPTASPLPGTGCITGSSTSTTKNVQVPEQLFDDQGHPQRLPPGNRASVLVDQSLSQPHRFCRSTSEGSRKALDKIYGVIQRLDEAAAIVASDDPSPGTDYWRNSARPWMMISTQPRGSGFYST